MGLVVQGWPVRARPAGWLTLAGAARVAAAAATALAFGTAVLAVLGHDVSAFLVPEILGFAWMGCLLLSRRPGHPIGPLLCLTGLAVAASDMSFTYERYTLVDAPGALPFGTTMLWVNTWAYAPATGLGGLVLPLVFPEGRLLSRRWRPALWAALAFIPLSAASSAFLRRTWAATSVTCRTRMPPCWLCRCSMRSRSWQWHAGRRLRVRQR